MDDVRKGGGFSTLLDAMCNSHAPAPFSSLGTFSNVYREHSFLFLTKYGTFLTEQLLIIIFFLLRIKFQINELKANIIMKRNQMNFKYADNKQIKQITTSSNLILIRTDGT